MTKTLPLIALALLAACARDGEIDPTGGVAITRSSCPAVGVPAQTGDVTIFNPASSREARAIDVVATITNVRTTCNEGGAQIVSNATFDIQARRTNASGAREVVLPYFATVIRGGNTVVSKRVSRVALRFEDGQLRASGSGSGGAVVERAAATLPPEILERLRRKRKADDADASIDPLAAPDVRASVARASFELLVGFQLTADQLQYNATR